MTTPGEAWVVVLVVGDDAVIIGRLIGVRPDLAVVNALARLRLGAQRAGYSVRVQGPCQDLSDVLELVGLADVVVADPDRLIEEPGRQTKGLE
ncbi:MAG: hypothetical protein WD646_14685 [Actinomycetota bacterium]